MKLTYKAYRWLSLGQGKLSIEVGYDPSALKFYDGGGPSAFRMIYQEGEQIVEIASFAALLHFAKVNKINVESAVSANPNGWADLIFAINRFFSKEHRTKAPSLLGTSIISSDTATHRQSYAKRGIIFDEVAPSVANGVLTWHAIKREESGSELLKYECNLKTFEMSHCSIRRLRESD
jgi:hypothetical protein